MTILPTSPLGAALALIGTASLYGIRSISDLIELEKMAASQATAYAVLHPTLVSTNSDPEEFGHNDGLDAIRHAYASALVAIHYGPTVGPVIAQILGTIHEVVGPVIYNVPNTMGELNMDLWNNAAGRRIAARFTTETAPAEVLAAIVEAYAAGELITDPYAPGNPIIDELAYAAFEGLSPEPPTPSMFQRLLANDLRRLGQEPLAMLKTAVSRATETVPPLVRYDPLALDLNRDGLLTASVAQGAYFDMATDGFAEKSGWVQAGDALVVCDLNGNGAIDNGSELFGDQTLLPNGQRAANGFTALAALDSSADGVFNAQDAAWGEVKLWKDDGDGITEDGELVSLEAADVQAIQLGYTNVGTTDAAGNILAQFNAAGAQMTDGTSVAAASFLLASDSMDTAPTEYLDLTETIISLPELIGSGKAYDISQAMARDTTLEAMVSAAATSTDYASLATQFDAILLRWTGASAVDVQSRGSFINAQHLAAVEAFYGQPFQGVGGANPNANAAPILESTYQDLKSQLFTQFVAQAQLKDYWDAATVTWDDATDSTKVDYSGTAAKFTQDLAAQPATTVGLLALFAMNAKAFGVSASPEFAAFEAGFSGSESYDKAIEAGLNGTLPTVGTDLADSLTLTSAGPLYGLAGNDTLTGLMSHNNVLIGGAGNDTLYGKDWADTLEGGDGDDILDGGDGPDILRGGAGDDTLGGAIGSIDSNSSQGYTEGNTYEGGIGNDLLRGTLRRDTYLFGLGDGKDTIFEPGGAADNLDVIRLGVGIEAADITVSRVGTSLVLAHVNGLDAITINNWFTYGWNTANQVESVVFADGTVWSNAQLTERGLAVTGTAGDDTLTGLMSHNNVLSGGAGNDTLYGKDWVDTLDGGDGDDTLDGGDGPDVLRGGAGNDTLGGAIGSIDSSSSQWYTEGNTYEGGIGNDLLRGTLRRDTYLFGLGDGKDTIVEPGGAADSLDVIRFGAGIEVADITVSRVGASLVLAHANGLDAITINNWFTYGWNTANQVESVVFADGTVWSNAQLTTWGLTVKGTDGNDTLTGLMSHNNVLSGGAGNDALYGKDWVDTLEGGDGDDTLDGGDGPDVLRGGAGNDTLGGPSGGIDSNSSQWYTEGNTYDGGIGNDLLRGTLRRDTYLFGLGDGKDTIVEPGGAADNLDVIRFGVGIEAADIIVSRVGASLVLAHTNGLDAITINNWFTYGWNTANQVESVAFADGTTWTGAQLTNWGITVTGTAGNDTLTGLMSYNNALSGGAGNDTLYGKDWADTLEGGDGDDTLDGGDGPDILRGGAGNDTLGGPSGSIDSSSSQWYAEGNTYEGGVGNDLLRGTLRRDTYLFSLGDGKDTILEPGGAADNMDVIRFGIGIEAADIGVSRVGTSLVLAHANGLDAITINNWYASSSTTANQVESVVFADGTVWSNTQLTDRGLAVTGTAGADALTGLAQFANALFGGAGDDTLTGGGLTDLLTGGTGNDALFGGAGNDIYNWTVGDGYDTLTDAAGTDTIDFSAIDVVMAQFFKSGNDLEINIGDSASGMLVKNQLLATGSAIEQFKFADATLSASEVQSMAILRV